MRKLRNLVSYNELIDDDSPKYSPLLPTQYLKCQVKYADLDHKEKSLTFCGTFFINFL